MLDDFTNAPVSISEARRGRSQDDKDWTPRDVLVSILRSIDSGECKPEHLVVFLRERENDGFAVKFRKSTNDFHTCMGMIEDAKMTLYQIATEDE